jgi:hypothetical protein
MYYKLNLDGFYLGVKLENNEGMEFFTQTPPPSNTNFIKPQVIDDVWFEGATEEEIEEYQKSLIPPTISQMNLRLQLIAENISIASVYDTIEQIPDAITKETIYTKWEYALIFERADQTLNQMAQMLNVSQEQLDRIFINGNQN